MARCHSTGLGSFLSITVGVLDLMAVAALGSPGGRCLNALVVGKQCPWKYLFFFLEVKSNLGIMAE